MPKLNRKLNPKLKNKAPDKPSALSESREDILPVRQNKQPG